MRVGPPACSAGSPCPRHIETVEMPPSHPTSAGRREPSSDFESAPGRTAPRLRAPLSSGNAQGSPCSLTRSAPRAPSPADRASPVGRPHVTAQITRECTNSSLLLFRRKGGAPCVGPRASPGPCRRRRRSVTLQSAVLFGDGLARSPTVSRCGEGFAQPKEHDHGHPAFRTPTVRRAPSVLLLCRPPTFPSPRGAAGSDENDARDDEERCDEERGRASRQGEGEQQRQHGHGEHQGREAKAPSARSRRGSLGRSERARTTLQISWSMARQAARLLAGVDP